MTRRAIVALAILASCVLIQGAGWLSGARFGSVGSPGFRSVLFRAETPAAAAAEAPRDGLCLELLNRSANFVLAPDGDGIASWINTAPASTGWGLYAAPTAWNNNQLASKTAHGAYFIDPLDSLHFTIGSSISTGTMVIYFSQLDPGAEYQGTFSAGDIYGGGRAFFYWAGDAPTGNYITVGLYKSQSADSVWFFPIATTEQPFYILKSDDTIASYSAAAPPEWFNAGRVVHLGNGYNEYGPAPLRGTIGGVWLYNRAISQSEAALWRNYL